MQDDLEKFIHHNRDNFDIKAPPPFVLDRIVQQLKTDDKKKPTGILISFLVIRWAAASLILVVCGIAFLTLRKHPADTSIVKTKVPIEATKSPDDLSENKGAANKTEPVKKRIDPVDDELSQNLTSKKLVMFAGLHNMESPASRITAAYAAEQLQNQGNDVVDALVKTLNSDPNSNVRLAALDGLARFYKENYIRRQLVASLGKQHDPVVQIAMINLLTRMRESAILVVLDRLVRDENLQKAVKDCAYSSILLLRSS
jgi:HEAT repeats